MKNELNEIIKMGRNLSVLYVEDNPEAREQTLKLLKNFFDNITVATNGEEGFQKFRKGSFDLIMTDINMPRLNGLDMLEKIRESDHDVIAIIISAHDETDYFTRSIRLGVDGYLLKPIDLVPMIRLLKKSLQKINMQKELRAYHENLEAQINHHTDALKKSFLTDEMTKINSRYALLQELENNRSQFQTIILLNIDDFTIYNELYGMEVGNDILVAFAHKLADFAPRMQYDAYRVSGDEFVLYRAGSTIEKCTCDTTVHQVLQMLEKEPLFIQKIDEHITISVTIGMACEYENPLGRADIALKYAKNNRKKYVLYQENMDNRVDLKKTLYWRKEIKTALVEDRIVPYFQPIVNREQKITKYEALMRILQYDSDHKIKIISPFEFLDIAIKTRLYDDLSYRMISKSIDMMKNRDVSLSLNINLSDINNGRLLEMLQRNIRVFNSFNAGNSQNHIILEVLENDNIEAYQIVNEKLSQFRNLAVKIAIDDFGSGYSNFSQIIGIAPHYLKIDGSLIRDIDTNPKSYEMVKAIVQFAKSLGIKTIAEFVSSEQIFEITYELGIDEFQGYYFGKPMSIGEIEAMEQEKLIETADTVL